MKYGKVKYNLKNKIFSKLTLSIITFKIEQSLKELSCNAIIKDIVNTRD